MSPASGPRRLRAATRSSPLARWQTETVLALLQAAHPRFDAERSFDAEPVFVETLGDRTQALGTPLHEIGGQGVFVKEVQAAVLDGLADIAVHSAKDLPSKPAPGLVIAAVPTRGDARDALIGSTLAALRPGAVIGTGSVRRRAQMLALRPDLQFRELRGNVGTRIEKASQFDAIVLAAVPLSRLGLEDRIAEILGTGVMLPMIGQGALAVECREDDEATLALLAAINDPVSSTALRAERAYLARLGGGCDRPVAALASVDADGSVMLEALVSSLDGQTIVRGSARGNDPEAVGRSLAEELLATGAAALLDGWEPSI